MYTTTRDDSIGEYSQNIFVDDGLCHHTVLNIFVHHFVEIFAQVNKWLHIS